MRASDYHDLVGVSDPRLSPDGEQVAFIRSVPKSDTEYEATIYLVSSGGEGNPRRFTSSDGVDAEPRWSPDGESLAFTSTRGEREGPQLYVLATDGGEARQITDVVGGVSAISWRPDSQRIAFVQSCSPAERREDLDLAVGDAEYEREPPDPRVIDRSIYRAGTQYFDGRHSGVYTVDLASDSVERVSDDGSAEDEDSGSDGERPAGNEREYDYVSPTWGDSETLYYAAKRGEDPDDSMVFDVIAHDVTQDESETITRTSGWEVTLAANSTGEIAFPYTPEERATLRGTDVRVYDRDEEATHTLTEDLDRTAAGPLRWGPDEKEVYFLTPDEGQVAIRAAAVDEDRKSGDGEKSVRTVVRRGETTGFDAGSEVAFVGSEWNHPGEVFVVGDSGGGDSDDSATNDPRRLTDQNAELLGERTLAEPEEVRFESEGTEIQGWVLYPPEDDGRSDQEGEGKEEYPLVVEIHGGPHAMWSASGTMFQEFQTLAAQGYAVFWCNPRGSVGYGEDFQSAIEGEWGAVTARDVLAGVDRICERADIDETNQFVTGGSFGGYMTAWLVGHTDRFRGAVTQRGVYDLASFYGSTDAYKLIEWDFGVTPWEDFDGLRARSPVTYAGDVETPTLVIHAERDYRVPVNNAEMLHLFYRKNGVETRLVRYPREGHELSRSGEPAHVVDRLARIARWFDGYSAHHDAPKALERGGAGLPGTDGED
jgi:dipeptidyl aminopeptidase/acylaminoacyl peptidase